MSDDTAHKFTYVKALAKSSEIIVMEMLEFIYREGGHPNNWCIGVTNDPRRRLFDEHQIHYKNDSWIYRTATSEGDALQVHSYFLEFGLVKGEEVWQSGACAVYAYRKHAEPFIKARLNSARARSVKRRLGHNSLMFATEAEK
jgi:hypothetical protein